jgi:acyl-coenzyme A thioesterase PaaI-like protein
VTAPTDLAALFERIPFQRHTQLELLADLSVRAPDIPELKNHFGTMHGGMLYALGEVASAAAMAQLLELDQATLFAVTRRGEIAYLKPARGAITSGCQISMTRAELLGALERQRSVDVPITVTLSDPANTTVATLDLLWYVAKRR